MALTTTRSGLDLVHALICAGDTEAAHGALKNLATRPDALSHIETFIELSIKLRKADAIDSFLIDALPAATQVAVLFRFVAFYRRLDDRRSAFKRLMQIVQLCGDSAGDLRKAATYFAELGEFRFAQQIRERLLQSAPEDYMLALDVIHAKEAQIPNKGRAERELKKIRSELAMIMEAPDLPAAAWERASGLYEQLWDLSAAVNAIRKAVERPESGFGVRFRLAELLTRMGLAHKAKRELVSLFAECASHPTRLRMCGDLALKLSDHLLAQKFAEAQFQSEPTNPECVLYLMPYLRKLGDRIRAKGLLSSLYVAERESPFMSDNQWVRFVEESIAIGDIDLAKKAVTEVTARAPESSEPRKLAARIAFLEKVRQM